AGDAARLEKRRRQGRRRQTKSMSSVGACVTRSKASARRKHGNCFRIMTPEPRVFPSQSMAGVNPYIKKARIELPVRSYRIKFILGESKEERIVEVDPTQIPYDRTGNPGSILEIALGNGIEIDHSCGGVCACSTCHVIVREGLESCNEATDDEMDMV